MPRPRARSRLEGLTKAELIELCKKDNIKGYSGKTKDELIEMLTGEVMVIGEEPSKLEIPVGSARKTSRKSPSKSRIVFEKSPPRKTSRIEFRKSPPREPSITPFETSSTASTTSGEDIIRTVDIPKKCNDPKEPVACKTDEVCNVDTGSCLPSKDVKGTVETVNVKGNTYKLVGDKKVIENLKKSWGISGETVTPTSVKSAEKIETSKSQPSAATLENAERIRQKIQQCISSLS